MKPLVDVEQLRKSYGPTVAADHLSFSAVEGEVFGLLGPNGVGKTTTVECLQGLRRADGGRLQVLGLDPQSQAGQLRALMGSH